MAKQVEWSKYQFFEVVVAIYRRKESVMKLWIHHFYNINKLFTNKGIINNFSRFRIRNIYRNIISSDLTAHSYKSSFCNKAFYQTKTQTNKWLSHNQQDWYLTRTNCVFTFRNYLSTTSFLWLRSKPKEGQK